MGNRGDRPHLRRFDGPHNKALAEPGPPVAPAQETLHVLAGSDSAVASEQLQRQASQLGERLRVQLRDIDARESEFHARVARMENELRTARLVFRERDHAIEEQKTDFEQRLKKLNEWQSIRIDDPNARLAGLPPANVGEYQPGVISISEAVHIPAEQIPTATPLQASQNNGDHSWNDEAWQKRFQKRLQELDVQENLLKSRLATVSDQQQKLERRREQLELENFEQTNRIEDERREARREFDNDRHKLRSRADELERRSLAVQEMQANTNQMYREAIELRLCTEGLIGQLEETLSPAEVAQRLASLRCQLDDQYKLANESLMEQQAEIERLIERLGEHESRTTEQRDEVRAWVNRRQQEIEEQASKLLQRERQLSKQEASFRSLESEWSLQRESYEQEIRRLKRKTMV